MKLKRLILQGFKSFKDKTVIHFDNGITGIVGPNGCGKSNIVDALFWVMGEQSARHLRGNNMKDVIFSGSDRFSPASWAEVSLILDNEAGKHIHIGNKVTKPTEIQLTRKLYRNGETEYRINGLPARLKDIQEVFMDTGAGAKSYSIIAQGEIDRLVNAKPIDRRTIIEEVAGITKFKLRKRESLKKIEQTRLNLNRLNDLTQEISKNLSSLEAQAQKAERARVLKDKIKKNDLIVASHEEFELLKSIRENFNFLNEKKADVQLWESKKDSLEIGLAEERIQKDELTNTIDQLQQQFNELSKNLAAAEERLHFSLKNIEEKTKLHKVRTEENIEIQTDIENRKKRLDELFHEKEEVATTSESEEELEQLEEKVSELKIQVSSAEENVEEIENNISQFKENCENQEHLISKNTSMLEKYANDLQDTTVELETLEKQYSSVSSDISNERDLLQEKEMQVDQAEIETGKLKEKVQELTQEKKEIDETSRNYQGEKIKMDSLLSSLEEINSSVEGPKKGGMAFLENNDLQQSYRILGDIVECQDKYVNAVQNVLAQNVDSIISQNSDAGELMDWCQAQNEHNLDFIHTENSADLDNNELIERLEVNGCQGIIPLREVVTFKDASFAPTIRSILDRCFIVANLDESFTAKLPLDLKFKIIVSPDGKTVIFSEQLTRKLKITNSMVDSSQGVIARNNKIRELTDDLAKLNKEIVTSSEKFMRVSELLQRSQVKYDQIYTDFTEAKIKYSSDKSAFDAKVSNLETGNVRIDLLVKRKAETSSSRLNLLEKDETLQQELKCLIEKREELKEIREDRNEILKTSQINYQEEKEVLLEKQIAIKSYTSRLNSVNKQITDVEEQIEKYSGRRESNKNLLHEYEKEISDTKEIVSKLEVNNKEQAGNLKTQENKLRNFKDDLAQLMAGMQGRENEVKDINKKINKTEKQLIEKEVKVDQYQGEEEHIVKDIFEKYSIDLRNILSDFLEYTENDFQLLNDITNVLGETARQTYVFDRRYGKALKECEDKLKNYRLEMGSLGNINWDAIEEYDRQKIRLDFLKKQETELLESLSDLEDAIEHVDQKSRVRFKEAFEEVDIRFQKVFPIIFGGGGASLKVLGDIESDESGIDIIACPPGKKMQNINLMSGGEKALTAVSLIFSIFLVKPSPFCLLDEVDAPLDDANVGRFNELLREMSSNSQFILITHNKKTMEMNDTLYGITMQNPGISNAVSVQLQ